MGNRFSRREVIGLGIGAAALGAYSLAGAATNSEQPQGKNNDQPTDIAGINKRNAEDLERVLILRTSPVAVKMVSKEEEIPKDAVRPKRDRGYHLTQCQAVSMSRRDKTTIAMLKEDNWCPTAVMAYGFVEKPASVNQWSHPYDSFDYGKYIGIVTAPLSMAAFQPDVVLVYAKPAQLRGLLLSMKIADVPEVSHHFFPPSCGWSVVNPIKEGKYYVVLPDPGEYQRALTEEGDLIFSIPQIKMAEMMVGLRKSEHGPFSYRDHQMFMETDFPLPELYKEMFKKWGMDTE